MSTNGRIVSNLARFMAIIWFFVVLILTKSYTTSLTSMLIVQQLNPTIIDIKKADKEMEACWLPKGLFCSWILDRMDEI